MKTFLSHALAAWMTIVLIALTAVLTSCNQAPDPLAPDLEKSRLPFADTPDQLMRNFVEAYGSQDLAEYAAMLHPGFVFELTLGSQPQSWGRDEELAIAARMFSREDYVKPGRTVAGIARIEVVRFEGLGHWRPSSEDGAGDDNTDLARTYTVLLRFHQTDGNVITVRGASIFHVRLDLLEAADGVERQGWRIVRQVDRTG